MVLARRRALDRPRPAARGARPSTRPIVVVGGYWSRLLGDIDTAYRSNRPTIGGGALEAIPAITAGRVGADAALAGARRQARERLVAEPLLLAG